MNTPNNGLSEDSIDLADLIELTADIEGWISTPEAEVQMTIENVTMSLPVQLEFGEWPDGALAIGAIPPAHYVSTSFTSVFHQLQLTLIPINPSTD
jgi:hypothetical protein